MSGQTDWENRIKRRFLEYQGEGTEEDFFTQWTFTGKFVDHGRPSAACGLCGNQKLRYHFLVAHRETGEAMWVGSQCILNFGVSDKRISKRQRDARRADDAALRHESVLAEKSVLAIIDQLQNVYQQVTQSDQRKIRWLAGKFQQRGAFSPQDAAWIFQVMLVCGVRPEFELFPISLRTKKEKAELLALPLTTRRLVAASLTDGQKVECEKLGIRFDF